MAQTLRSQPIPIAAMEVYRWRHSSDQLQSYFLSHSSSAKCSRNRGVILSPQGWQKLMQAGVLYDEFGSRYTYERLSERSSLDERTVSRLLSCEVKVDKRTLKTFFSAFNLSLEAGDYTLSNRPNAREAAMKCAPRQFSISKCTSFYEFASLQLSVLTEKTVDESIAS